MVKLTLYGTLGSPPVRTAALTLHALELDYEFKNIDILNGEHKSEEYLKKNPQHTVPMLEDDDECIWDSHAIAGYLVRKYGKTDELYPKDDYQRAVVDQRLHFDSGVLFARALRGFMVQDTSQEEKIASVLEAYDFLEAFLADNTYIAGDHLTIADLSILATISTLNLIVPVNDSGKTPKLSTWMELLKQLPYYEEVNGKGLAIASEMFILMQKRLEAAAAPATADAAAPATADATAPATADAAAPATAASTVVATAADGDS